MHFIVVRLSNKNGAPLPQCKHVGKTLFGDPVYGIDVPSFEDLFKLAVRAPSSGPGDVGLTLWRTAPAGMSLPPELEKFPVIEIYDDVRDSY